MRNGEWTVDGVSDEWMWSMSGYVMEWYGEWSGWIEME